MGEKTKKERIRDTLFYLGKGVWRSIPVLGPIVDEVIYKQFEDEIRGVLERKIIELPPERVDLLIDRLPSQEDLQASFAQLEVLSWEQRLEAASHYAELLDALGHGFENVTTRLGHIHALLVELGDRLASKEEVEHALTTEELHRLKWRQRISKSQIDLLNMIPRDLTHVSTIEEKFKVHYPATGRVEFRFRLHELEWLKLVVRCRSSETGDWLYSRYTESEVKNEGST